MLPPQLPVHKWYFLLFPRPNWSLSANQNALCALALNLAWHNSSQGRVPPGHRSQTDTYWQYYVVVPYATKNPYKRLTLPAWLLTVCADVWNILQFTHSVRKITPNNSSVFWNASSNNQNVHIVILHLTLIWISFSVANYFFVPKWLLHVSLFVLLQTCISSPRSIDLVICMRDVFGWNFRWNYWNCSPFHEHFSLVAGIFAGEAHMSGKCNENCFVWSPKEWNSFWMQTQVWIDSNELHLPHSVVLP